MSKTIINPVQIIICGLPGTLKTFLSSRIAHRLGAVWLPTSALGSITTEPGQDLENKRIDRYNQCVESLKLLGRMRARVVVDGGFQDVKMKKHLFSAYPVCPKILIECWSPDETRLSRLKIRSQNKLDVEKESAKSIINHWQGSRTPTQEGGLKESPSLDQYGCNGFIRVNTSNFTFMVWGEIKESLQERILNALKNSFNDFKSTDKLYSNILTTKSFDDLAPRYEESTEWRADETLLKQLRTDLPRKCCEVLDIGSGTGLASKWYTEQGHRCIGVDISPQMSVRAAPRLLFTNFGSAIDLPYFDQSFDLIIMRQVLHYTEPSLALQEISRVLRPKGKVIISTAVSSSESVKPIWEEFKSVTQPLRLRTFSENDLKNFLSQENFSFLECRHSTIKRNEKFSNLSKRAKMPPSGWKNFMEMMGKILSNEAPEIEFKVSEDSYSYRQFWCTIIYSKNR